MVILRLPILANDKILRHMKIAIAGFFLASIKNTTLHMNLKHMNSQQNWVSLMTAIVALNNRAIFVVRIHPVFRNIFSSLGFRQFVKAYIMGCQTVTATTVLTSSHLTHVLKKKFLNYNFHASFMAKISVSVVNQLFCIYVYQQNIAGFKTQLITQRQKRPRTDLNKRFLPRPNTVTA